MTDDWFDLLSVLLARRARFLVVGAHAMAVHGVPRGTQDMDVWIEPSVENAALVWAALHDFGAPLADLKLVAADLTRPDQVIQIGLPPNRIDVLTSLSGLSSFTDAWLGRVEFPIRDRLIPFLGRQALVQNKRATARFKDLADIEALGELADE